MSARPSSGLLLTRRALIDFQEIRSYSVRQWGRKTAEDYLDDLEAGLERIRLKPDLLHAEPDLHPSLKFYRVRKHLFVCDVHSKSIVVLTVIYAGRGLPRQLVELQPTLQAEVEILHRRIRNAGDR